MNLPGSTKQEIYGLVARCTEDFCQTQTLVCDSAYISGSLNIYFIRDDGGLYSLSDGNAGYILGDMESVSYTHLLAHQRIWRQSTSI